MSSPLPTTTTRVCDLGEQVPGVVECAGLEGAGLVLGRAREADAFGRRAEAVTDVQPEHVGVEELHRRLRPVVGDRGLERVERRSAATCALDQRRRLVLRPVDIGREDDRLERHDQVEQLRLPVGGHQQRCTAHRVAERDEATVRGDRAGGGERVVAVAMPVDLPVVGARRRSVAAVVERVRREPVGQSIGDREVAVAVEAGGVRQQQRTPRSSEFVDGNADVI